MTMVTLGIDLGKNLNSVVGLDAGDRVVLRRRVRRATLADLADKLQPCTVAMEACCGAHHVGRLFAAQGHEVRLMSPEYVRPYVRAQKNDDNDAAGIAEAATRPSMRFVELKSQDRLDLQTLHRARSRLVAARKTLVNQLRAILLERGHTFRQGREILEREIDPFLAEPPADLSARMLRLVGDMRAEWRSLNERINVLNDDLSEHARTDEAASRLASIPGIGVLGATALVAAIGDGEAFRQARDVPAWLGLVPKQMTTGGKPRLLRITKRGNVYLRMLLIHGARAALPSLSKQATPLGEWLRGLLSRAHRNVVIVALAAKLARIAWATLQRGVRFHPQMGAAAMT
ncbi:IS110 family transposase (plasmid) [Rhizobium rosettiformans]|uniref:IS110 family transposase n=1 Tax=Rhizobium rosettiformans TaxID=1368430 RepID=A0ABX7F3F5_9HYPH|nr:IS110 family transposase [Rhizobium rosettiformans]QRF54325.1 IS110 family transposase [Rhizobium rosettiformans]